VRLYNTSIEMEVKTMLSCFRTGTQKQNKATIYEDRSICYRSSPLSSTYKGWISISFKLMTNTAFFRTLIGFSAHMYRSSTSPKHSLKISFALRVYLHQATYSERGITFQRIISTVFSKSGNRCRSAALQYIHRDGSEDDVVMLSPFRML
jgi:hypothetical protein